jgi:S1-C subfamily serine protease
LPVVHLGDSNSAQQGDGVLAIGNALALAGGPTVTEGIVSALDRSLTATTDAGTTERLTGLLQTDAPINPGNSGGPLVNSAGQVVAMNTAVATSSQGNAPAQNVGFGIAVNEIRSVATEILGHPIVP